MRPAHLIVCILATAVPLIVAGCGGSGGDQTPPPATAPQACPAQLGVGYRVATIGGVKAAVWYPTAAAEAAYPYSSTFAGSLALNAAPTTCATFPVVVFSHGLFGCGTQSLFITETLARRGYVVVAPDHPDALCSVDNTPPSGTTVNEPSVLDPAAWNDTTYSTRFEQVRSVIDALVTSSPWTAQIDATRIGVAGHSLGGYTAFGLIGGWTRWNDSRIKAVLLLSPYLAPYQVQQRIGSARGPMMYQGAQFDLGITPGLVGASGAYALSNTPKYLAVLTRGSHFEWTNVVCASTSTVASCLQGPGSQSDNPKLMTDYATAFFDRHLKNIDAGVLDGSGAGLLLYQKQL